jgi:hypothetical protein
MIDDQTYSERLSSKRTEALFVGLTLLFGLLAIWRVSARGLDGLVIIFLCGFILFLFYSLNYRVLLIRLTTERVELRFGIFTWRTSVTNIERCYLDDISLWRISGAGIHFSPIGGRYRAMFNFLEYQRVVMMLKVKQGLVRDIAFTTRQPDKVLRLIQDAISAKNAT